MRVCAVVVRRIGIGGARLVALDQARERQGVRGAPPAGFRPRERARGLARGEPFLLLDADIARLQQAAEVARREVGFDPVAEADQRASRPRERGGNAGAERDRPVVAQRLFPDERDVRIRGARDLHLVERRPGGQNPPKDLFDLRFATAGMEQVDRVPAMAADDGGVIRNASGFVATSGLTRSVGRGFRRRGMSMPGSANARGCSRSPGSESRSRRWSGFQLASGSSVQQSCGWIGHQSGCRTASWYTVAMSARLWSERNCSYARSSATSSRVLRGRRERGGREGVRSETSHPQFAHGGPERLRERRMPGERPEVTAFAREREEETHHQRRTELLLGRVDAALDEERRAHAERDVEGRDEPEVGPVGALEDQSIAERPADGVRRHEHPLRSRGIGRAETFQLVDKWVHVSLL